MTPTPRERTNKVMSKYIYTSSDPEANDVGSTRWTGDPSHCFKDTEQAITDAVKEEREKLNQAYDDFYAVHKRYPTIAEFIDIRERGA